MIVKTEQLDQLTEAVQKEDLGKRNVFFKLGNIQDWDSTEGTFNLDGATFKTTPFARKQLLKKLHIPAPYYEACSPELRDKELREAFAEASTKVEYNFRVKGDVIYGIVPKQYYALLSSSFLQKLMEQLPEDCELKEYELTMEKLRMRFISRSISFIENDTLQAGVDITYSEVGASPFILQTSLFRQVCSNGLLMPEGVAPSFKMPMTRFKDDQFAANISLLPDRIYRLQQPVAELFERLKTVELPCSVGKELEGDLKTALDLVMPSRALQRDYKQLVLEAYEHEDNHTVNGLMNAVTRVARDLESGDKFILESSAGSFLSKLGSLQEDHVQHNQELVLTIPNIKRLFARHS